MAASRPRRSASRIWQALLLSSFITFNQLILPPPLPAIVGLLFVSGIFRASALWLGRLRGHSADAVDRAAAFVVTTAMFTAVVHGLALAGWLRPSLLRLAGAPVLLLGVWQWALWLPGARASFSRLRRAPVWQLSTEYRATLFLALAVFVLLAAAALGPFSDGDSADYHLGVPLDWLRAGGAYARPDWFHARLVGLGEMVNLQGLAMGSDGFGALFQLAGLLVALVAVLSNASAPQNRALGAALVLFVPVMSFLVPNQKPQLLPAAATAIALVLIVRRWDDLDSASIFLAFAAVAFAMASKYSYILSGSVVVAMGLFAAGRSGRLLRALVILGLALALLALPVWTRNFAYYGDPLSPFFARWQGDAYPGLAEFAAYVRSPRTPAALALLPFNLIAPTSVAAGLRSSLGIGVLAFLLLLNRRERTVRLLLLAALAAAVLVLLLGRLEPRFFLESYLWLAAAVVAVVWTQGKQWFLRLLLLQGLFALALAFAMAATRFPGALTAELRQRTMIRYTPGYEIAAWVDRQAPAGATLFTADRIYALLPRPFLTGDTVRFRAQNNDLSLAERARSLVELAQAGRADTLLLVGPIPAVYEAAAPCLGRRLAGPERFTSRRNLLNLVNYTAIIGEFDFESEACRALLESAAR